MDHAICTNWVRRSDLAPISGFIQPYESPTTAAWRELRQQHRLTSRDVELYRKGKPFTFDNDEISQVVLYPFAFQLKTQDEAPGEHAMEPNAQQSRWEWHDAKEVIHKMESARASHIAQSLRCVCFEAEMNKTAGNALRIGLEQLKNDHESGSHELTTKAMKTFRDVLANLRGESTWWETACTAAWHLWKNGRESMGAATLNALLRTLAELKNMVGRDSEDGEDWRLILAIVDQQLEERQKLPLRIKDSFALYLQINFLPVVKARSRNTLTILTTSASSTIRDCILGAFASLPIPNLDLRILESRPLFEGASMGSSLLTEFQLRFPPSSGRFLNMTIYTDASAALAAVDADFVLLGADRISHLGEVSNKTGSLPTVLSAKHISPSVKILVLSSLEKIADPESQERHESEKNSRTEVISSWLSSGMKGADVIQEGLERSQLQTTNCTVDVGNVYFEWVPGELIDEYICEEGICNTKSVRQRANEIKRMIDEFFGLP